MLSEQVLEFLARKTPVQERLVSVSWPSLSVESKLQLIESVQRGASVDRWTPDWLMGLAIEDEAAVVRYWAARNFSFKDGSGEDRTPFFGAKATDADKSLHALAKSDPEWLVRQCAEKADLLLAPEAMSKASQEERLFYLRHQSMPDLTSFLEWLSMAVDEGVPDAELHQCAEEIFKHPLIQEELTRPALDYPDGGTAHYSGRAVTVGWSVVRKGGRRLKSYLSYNLPTSMGLGRITPEELASLPAEVIKGFGFRAGRSEEIVAAIDLVLSHPENYPEPVQKAAGTASEAMAEFDVSKAEIRAMQESLDKGQATLDTVLALKEQMEALTEQVRLLANEANKKRGFFS